MVLPAVVASYVLYEPVVAIAMQLGMQLPSPVSSPVRESRIYATVNLRLRTDTNEYFVSCLLFKLSNEV
jgi:hypothetical protein